MDELRDIAEGGYMPFLKAAKEEHKSCFTNGSVTPGMACVYYIVSKGILGKGLLDFKVNKYLNQFLEASPEQLASILMDYLITNYGYRYTKITSEIHESGKGFKTEPTPIILEFARDHLIPILRARAKEIYADTEARDKPLNICGVGYQQGCWLLLNLIDPSKKVLRLDSYRKYGKAYYQIFLEHDKLSSRPKKKPISESAAITQKINSVLSFFSNPVFLYKVHCVEKGTQLFRYLDHLYDIPKVFPEIGLDVMSPADMLTLNPEHALRVQRFITGILNRRKKILSMMPSSYSEMYLSILSSMAANVMELITLEPGSPLHTVAELLLEGVSPERIAKLAYSRHSKNLKPIQP